MHEISLPDFCLTLMVGAAGAGKSAFAARHFAPDEVIAAGDAETARARVAERLAARLPVVLDAPHLSPAERKSAIDLARAWHAPVAAIALDLDAHVCIARNAERAGAPSPRAVRAQVETLRHGLADLAREGVAHAHIMPDPDAVAAVAAVTRAPLAVDRRDLAGPFDIIGDVHGCAGELETLLARLGYALETSGPPGRRSYAVASPQRRMAVFVGDLVDRGPRAPDVLRLVRAMVEGGTGLCVRGNHDDKLARVLAGHNVTVRASLQMTLDQLAEQEDGFTEDIRGFLDGLVSHYMLDGGRLAVAHAALPEAFQNRMSKKIDALAMFGETTGRLDESGFPERLDWRERYRGAAMVVYGHTVVAEPSWLNGALCVDTGCVFGGALTALRYPERELVSVPAERTHFVSTHRGSQSAAKAAGQSASEGAPQNAAEGASS